MEHNRYGFSRGQWDKAKEEMHQIMAKCAQARSVIPYSELVARVTAIKISPESYALASMLGEISSDEDSKGHGMLSVVVVHKRGDYQPGPGFFDLAKQLGRDTSDIVKCWIHELHKVHDYWNKNNE